MKGSEPDKIVAEARRSGKQWFVAVMSGSDATTLDIPLNFIGQGRWQGVLLREDQYRPDAWKREDADATQKETLHIQLASRGGFVGWFRPLE